MFHAFIIAATLASALLLEPIEASKFEPSSTTATVRVDDGRVAIGERYLDFEAPTADGDLIKLAELIDGETIVVLEWFCPTCRFDVQLHGEWDAITPIYDEFKEKGVKWLAINSSGTQSDAYTAEINQQMAAEWEIEYPIVMDTAGQIGKAYKAKTTPQFFVIDRNGNVAYIGAFDSNARMQAERRDGRNHVREAIKELLAGENVSRPKARSYGCAVKYNR